jgi:hypothetical protein
MVSLEVQSWNQVLECLQELEALRHALRRCTCCPLRAFSETRKGPMMTPSTAWNERSERGRK